MVRSVRVILPDRTASMKRVTGELETLAGARPVGGMSGGIAPTGRNAAGPKAARTRRGV